MAFACTQQLQLHGPVSVHADRTKEEIGCEGLEEANGVMGGIRVGGGNGDGNGVGGRNAVGNGVGGGNRDVNVVRVGDGAGTRTGVEANEGAHDGNEDGKRGIGSGRVEERRICAGKPRRVVDMMWKMGSTWAEGEKNKTRKYWFGSCQPRSTE